MKTYTITFIVMAQFFVAVPVFADIETQLGLGYGREFRGNTNLEQYELFWRQPVPYGFTLDNDLKIITAVETGLALVRERNSGPDVSTAARVACLPELIVSPNDTFSFLVGVGAGLMGGETEFTKHNLGGPFFLVSKIGMQLILAEHLVLEYVFYHQSNAGIYDYNAGLTMNALSLAYNF